MTIRGTLLLWAAVAVLGGYLWRSEGGADRHATRVTDSDATETGAPLLVFDPAKITALVLTDADGAVRILRDGTRWLRTANPPSEVPPGLVTGLLATLATLRPVADVATAASAIDLEEFGLLPPRHRIVLEPTDAALPLTLALGKRNPTWTGVYARRENETRVVLAGAVVRWDIDALLGAVRHAGRGDSATAAAP
jgi:hypothetical protein